MHRFFLFLAFATLGAVLTGGAYFGLVMAVLPKQGLPSDYKFFVLEEIAGPALFFDGGSSTHFSISAEQIGSSLGVAAFNIGDSAAVHGRDRVERALRYLQPGSVYVFSPEWPILVRENVTDAYIGRLFQNGSDYVRALPLHMRVWRTLTISPKYIIDRLIEGPDRSSTEEYRSAAIRGALRDPNARDGGYQFPSDRNVEDRARRQTCSQYIFGEQGESPNISSSFIYTLDLLDEMKSRGITVLISHPTTVTTPWGGDCYDHPSLQAIMEDYYDLLERRNFTVIGDAESFDYPPEFFHDTYYHLNPAGRVIHSDRLATLLEGELGSLQSNMANAYRVLTNAAIELGIIRSTDEASTAQQTSRMPGLNALAGVFFNVNPVGKEIGTSTVWPEGEFSTSGARGLISSIGQPLNIQVNLPPLQNRGLCLSVVQLRYDNDIPVLVYEGEQIHGARLSGRQLMYSIDAYQAGASFSFQSSNQVTIEAIAVYEGGSC